MCSLYGVLAELKIPSYISFYVIEEFNYKMPLLYKNAMNTVKTLEGLYTVKISPLENGNFTNYHCRKMFSHSTLLIDNGF